ncbi:myosin heavy chain IB [Trifolium pratense]|uniref:Myosin heavy chain IB n=1 Tax=Trifolium pratense TaxID=57577 RepID=A0A2K3PCJ2_TRIPR|nr:myosin heavy chain IB [Trifolium pratense]
MFVTAKSDMHNSGGKISYTREQPNMSKSILHSGVGDQEVLFADKILKFTGSGKMKSRILIITDFAVYFVDPEIDALKRRIALAAVDKICLSKLNDNFLAVIIPTEYDLLIASARKIEIITAFNEATTKASDYELDVLTSNRNSKHLNFLAVLYLKVNKFYFLVSSNRCYMFAFLSWILLDRKLGAYMVDYFEYRPNVHHQSNLGDKGAGCCVEWGLMELSLVSSGLAEVLSEPAVLFSDGL